MLFLIAGGLVGCDSGGSSAQECALQAGPDSESIPLTVDYSLSTSGDVSVARLTYRTDEGEQTVTDVSANWTQTVQVSAGTSVGLSATATVRDGEVSVAYDGQGQQGGTTVQIQGQDVCGRGAR